MSASNAFEAEVLELLLNNSNIANLGDATGVRGSSTAGSCFVRLHTADPGEAGDQTTNEATYTGYGGVAVSRAGAGWTIAGTAPTTASNASAVTFAPCSAGSNSITHFSVGFAISGASMIIVSGALTAPLAVSAGITPAFAIGALTATCD